MKALSALAARHWQRISHRPRQLYASLGSKEKKQLAWLCTLVLAAGLYFGLLQPALKKIRHWQADIPRLRTQAHTLRSLLIEQGHGALFSSKKQRGGLQALPAALATLGPYEQERHDDASLSLRFAPAADPAALINWLVQQADTLGLQVTDLSLARDPDPDQTRITVTVTLKEAHGT